MKNKDMRKWLIDLGKDIAQVKHKDLWHYNHVIIAMIEELNKRIEKKEPKFKNITADEIVEAYKSMMKRQEYENRWITPDGLNHITDVGYATDGAFFFLEELLKELNALDLLKEVEEIE